MSDSPIYMEVRILSIRDGKVFSESLQRSTELDLEQFHGAEHVLAQAMLSLGDKKSKK